MGRPTELKHRESLYSHYCAQIRREGGDLSGLEHVAERVLVDPHVVADAELSGMLRSFIASARQALRVALAESKGAVAGRGVVDTTFSRSRLRRRQLVERAALVERLRSEFREHVRHLDEPAAHDALRRIRRLRADAAEGVDVDFVDASEREYAALVARCDVFREDVSKLAEIASRAVEAGEAPTSAWALRRLAIVHALRPALLSDSRFDELRSRISASDHAEEARAAARRLVERERSVAAEIRGLAVAIRRFEALLETDASRDDGAFRREAAAYERAVRELRAHDTEWLAGLVIELNALAQDLRTDASRAETQLDHFVASVRDSLLRLRKEVQRVKRATGLG